MDRFLIAVALVAGLVLSPATAASAVITPSPDEVPPGVGIRLVDAPVATADDPRARVYIIDHVSPGTVIERRVEVANGTNETQQIAVYPAAAEILDGSFTGAEGRTQNELSRWVSVSPDEAELAPDGRTMVAVRIEVPSDASRGERYGAVWAEMTTPPESGNITQVSRVGIRIYLSVGPGGAPPSDFEITSLTPVRNADGSPVVRANVRNTGQRALDFTGDLRLGNGPGGLSAGPFDADPGTTLGIGETAPVIVVLDRALPDGPWRAQLRLVSGLERRAAEATITFPSAPGEAAAVPVDDTDGWPWWLLAVGVGLVLLMAGFLFGSARRRGRDKAEPARG